MLSLNCVLCSSHLDRTPQRNLTRIGNTCNLHRGGPKFKACLKQYCRNFLPLYIQGRSGRDHLKIPPQEKRKKKKTFSKHYLTGKRKLRSFSSSIYHLYQSLYLYCDREVYIQIASLPRSARRIRGGCNPNTVLPIYETSKFSISLSLCKRCGHLIVPTQVQWFSEFVKPLIIFVPDVRF